MWASYFDEMTKLSAAWERKLLSGEVKREAGRLAPMIRHAKEKYLAGLEKGNEGILKRLKQLGWDVRPAGYGEQPWSTSAFLRKIFVPKSLLDPGRKSNLVRRLDDAVIFRHELDEARIVEQASKRLYGKHLKDIPEEKFMESFVQGPFQDFAPTFAKAHISPEVIRRESISVSNMPSFLRKRWQKFRSGKPVLPPGLTQPMRPMPEHEARSFPAGKIYGRTVPTGKKQIKQWLAALGYGREKVFNPREKRKILLAALEKLEKVDL